MVPQRRRNSSLGNPLLASAGRRGQQLLDQRDQGLQSVSVEDRWAGGVRSARGPVRPVGRHGERALRRPLEDQRLSPRDPSGLQDQEGLIPEWMEGVCDTDISRKMVGGQCIAQ